MPKYAKDFVSARLCHVTQDTVTSISGASFFCVLDGSMTITMIPDNQTFRLNKEEVIYIAPDVPFSIHVKSPVLLLAAIFHPCFLLEHLGFKWEHICCNSTTGQHKDYKQIISHLAPLTFLPSDSDRIMSNYTYAKTFEFLHILEKYYIEPITESDPDACDASIFALKNFFNEHYMDNFSLSDVAAEFNYTPPYLSSLIKKKLHITFQEYITSCRLEAAFLYIKYTNDPFQKIYVVCGFSNQSSFLQAFKKKYGCSAEEWRLQHPLKDLLCFPDSFSVINSASLSRDYLFNYINYDAYSPSSREVHSTEETVAIRADVQNYCDVDFRTNEMLNLGSATDFNKPSFRNHIARFQEAQHFKYGRFSDILLVVSSIYIHDRLFYDFSRAFQIFDFLRNIHMLPLIELGNKPFHIYKLDETKISDYNIYNNDETYDAHAEKILPELLSACVARYGFDEVSTWKFELWRRYSPNMEFIEPAAEYVQRFSKIASILKSKLPDVALGGPGFNMFMNPNILRELSLAFRNQTYTPDFYSAYYFPYSGKDIINPPRADKKVEYHVSESIHDMAAKTTYLRRLLDSQSLSQTPLYITEYSAFISESNTLNDSVYPALFIIYQALNNYRTVNMCAYWLVSDISLEYHNPASILFGGNGLISRDGLFKPSCFAYTLLDMLGSQLVSQGDHYVITRDDDGTIQILLYYIGQLDSDFARSPSEHDLLIYPYSPFTKQFPSSFSIELENMHPGYHIIKEYRLSMEYGSIINSWKNLGYSNDLDPLDFEYMQSSSFPYRSSKKELIDGQYTLHATLNPNEAVMFVCKPYYHPYKADLKEKGGK